jgi:hypothetical protein
MIVRHVALRSFGDTRELSAQIDYEREPRESVPLWFRWPAEHGDPVIPGDVFLVGLLLPAMALHEDLTIEAPVSEAVATAGENLAPMLLRWFPKLREATVHAERGQTPLPSPDARGAGCFFSAGIDSFHSLIRHDERLTHLICIHGFEIDPDNQEIWKAASDNVTAVARRWDKALLMPSTNLLEVGSRETQRRLMRQGNPYDNFGVKVYFGSMLTAVGLALSGTLRDVVVPSSWPYEYTRPNGSHPLLEPRWSSPSLGVSLDGCEADRLQKVRAIAERAPHAYEHLRVCIDERCKTLNCGRCIKCVRTLMEMRACGVLDLASTFPGPLDLAVAKRLRQPPENHFLPMLLAEAERTGDTELAEATRVLLGRKRHWPREFDRARDALRGLSPIQVAWHVKAWLRRLLNRDAGQAS